MTDFEFVAYLFLSMVAIYMVLLFVRNDRIPFTNVRRFTEEKFRYYESSIGATFGIEYVEGD